MQSTPPDWPTARERLRYEPITQRPPSNYLSKLG